MKKKKVVKLKEEYMPKGNYFSKDALLTNIFMQSAQNALSEVESKNSQLIVNCINKLHKKNLQTKLKAINELIQHLSKYDEDEVSHLFSSFISVYKKLIYHPNYGLRENLNLCLKLFIVKVKTKIKAHLSVFLPPLFVSLFDYSKNVKNIAGEILLIIFPPKGKTQESTGVEDAIKQNSVKEKKTKPGKIRLQEELKLYGVIKNLKVNLSNLYNCLKYVGGPLSEEVTRNLKNKKNDEDYDYGVYLFNVVCFYPSLLYMMVRIAKGCDDNGGKPTPPVEENDGMVSRNQRDVNSVKQFIRKEFPAFASTFNLFFNAVNSIYKENKDNERVKKMLFLSVYNIIYLLKKYKLNYSDFDEEEANISIFNYISSVISNKDEYIMKHINHLLLLYFFSENKKMINDNFLKSYLSLIKHNKNVKNDIFNYNISLFIFIFEKNDIREFFFFFFFLFLFLLLHGMSSSLVVYYDLLHHLLGYFREEVTQGRSFSQGDDVGALYSLSESDCYTVLSESILHLPLETILAQKIGATYKCSFGGAHHLYEVLSNIYYCHKKKPSKGGKDKDQFEELKRKIIAEKLEEANFIRTYINFIKLSKCTHTVVLSSFDMLSEYTGDLAKELEADHTMECETLFPPSGESPQCVHNPSYKHKYHGVVDFILNLLTELKEVVFPPGGEGDSLGHITSQSNAPVRIAFIRTLKCTFKIACLLVEGRNYEAVGMVKKHWRLLEFLLAQGEVEDEDLSLERVFCVFMDFMKWGRIGEKEKQKQKKEKEKEKVNFSEEATHEGDALFSSLDVSLNLLSFICSKGGKSCDALARSLQEAHFEAPPTEETVEEQLTICVKLINFMKKERTKFFDLSKTALEIYSYYLLQDVRDERGIRGRGASLKAFYAAVQKDTENYPNLFGEEFYQGVFHAYKKKMNLSGSLPDEDFSAFFTSYAMGKREDIIPLEDIHLHLLLGILLNVKDEHVERCIKELYMSSRLSKDSILSFLLVMRDMYKWCRENDDEEKTGKLWSSFTSTVKLFEDDCNENESDDDDTSEVGEGDHFKIGLLVRNSLVKLTCIGEEEEEENTNCALPDNDLKREDEEHHAKGNVQQKKSEEGFLLLRRRNILNTKFIERMLNVYKLYYQVECFSVGHLKEFTMLCFDETTPVASEEKVHKNQVYPFCTFYHFAYANIRSISLFYHIVSLRDKIETYEADEMGMLDLLIYVYRELQRKKRKKKIPDKHVRISDLVCVMKQVNKWDIFNICRDILTNRRTSGEFSVDTMRDIIRELNNFKVKSLFDLQVKIFLFEECLLCDGGTSHLCHVCDINGDGVPRGDVPERDTKQYEDGIVKLKERLPRDLHAYVEKNLSLSVKGELPCLNLLYHLICISNRYPDVNLFEYTIVKRKVLLEMALQYVTWSNFDVFFCCLGFVRGGLLNGEESITNDRENMPKDGKDTTNGVLPNDIPTKDVPTKDAPPSEAHPVEEAFRKYLTTLKNFYRKMHDEQSALHRQKWKTLNEALTGSDTGKKVLPPLVNGKLNIQKSRDKKMEGKRESHQLLHSKMGLHFLKYTYMKCQKEKKAYLSTFKDRDKITANLVKLVYFILSISYHDDGLVDYEIVTMARQMLKLLIQMDEKNIKSLYKIYLFSLPDGVTHFFDYLTTDIFLLNELKLSRHGLCKLMRKILDLYVNTYYLFILFSNVEKCRDSNFFIDRTMSILIMNYFFFSELHKLRGSHMFAFGVINSYLHINEGGKNLFLLSAAGEEVDGHACRVLGVERDGQHDVEAGAPGVGVTTMRSHSNMECGDLWNLPDDSDEAFLSEPVVDTSKKKSKESPVSEQNEVNRKDTPNRSGESSPTLSPTKGVQKSEEETSQSHGSRNDTPPSVRLSSQGNRAKRDDNSKKKMNPLYALKNQLKNPSLLIDLNKNIMDLYSFVLDLNYLKILLSMLNISLSSEYFIYEPELHQQFMAFVESNNLCVGDFLSDVRRVGNILEEGAGKNKWEGNSSGCNQLDNLPFPFKHRKKFYIFLLALHLILRLITIYPNECITITNEAKLHDIVNFNRILFSNIIIANQINELRFISTEYINTTFQYDPLTKTLTFKYKIKEDDSEQYEDVTAKLTLTFLPNYPFSHMVISDRIESLDKKAQVHNSIKSMYKYARTGNINEMFVKFDSLMNGYFENKSQCNICFMILYETKTCDKACSQCGTSYHSYCLHKWFLTSHNTKCPSCQMQFT
ncbi:conserved Plasmodium protein, unknown function [Plasmodium knowlesi strain H]|uniref:E3 ubiquitin-protein ligase listerin n=3 Tax=Plasmodium knowlesi TaxID=5850 RepID=A0A5K1VUM3_PLAKH|nr:zinc finger protein, putative [Plasmodium knowlesi strain H]OTN64733.1 Uncharacterized protein PKNOH_S130200900 [Plasmodium knowlesi]CAA9989169.1 zinc finger protein, putative [Plasmodium knowlesi strain H]SBO27389.1 conserved Plasmodium protein, unknown function [Plasmodium knowlesi strain H]SBO27500.1 conserved Plasmodium protein, unknown function [Plasmodium knowlesi strain H]VVS78643.1 zinc finger protein, putative [Plasmodium knowlesi strain H]|eukprot:XP_002261516.1 hypothetical protein, conserved in Plasmodium species [Plasmodium knowlesi strain H]